MDAASTPGIHTVVLMTSAQVGKTSILENLIGFHIDRDPAPILVVVPTLDMAESFSKDRLAPMVRDTPALKGKIADPRARDSGNTLLHKRFPGGHITLAGANSAASLASRPIRIVLCDEVDRYPPSAGTEGDPVSLAKKRSTTFWNRLLVLASTPTVKGLSRIEMAFEQSDQRRYYVPCPHCGEYQPLKWAQVRWDAGKPETVRYGCAHCAAAWSEADKPRLLAAGQWRAERPEVSGTAGFHLNELYSPWRKWSEVVADFLAAKQRPETLKTWVNTSLGETWEETGDQPEPESLLARREAYPAEVPAGACVLTAGVDVQDDRLEVLIMGWGPGEEMWVIDGLTLWGDPGQAEVWTDLDSALTATYRHEAGTALTVSAAGIDSGGHYTQMVYDFCKTRQTRRVYALKGVGGPGRPLVSAPARKKTGNHPRKVALYSVGVDDAKGLLYSRYRLTAPGPGYLHLPTGHSLIGEEFCAQLTAEKIMTKYRRGFPVREWVKARPRNEALDCLVYALAAVRLLNPRYTDLSRALPAKAGAPKPPKPQGGGWINTSGDWL